MLRLPSAGDDEPAPLYPGVTLPAVRLASATIILTSAAGLATAASEYTQAIVCAGYTTAVIATPRSITIS